MTYHLHLILDRTRYHALQRWAAQCERYVGAAHGEIQPEHVAGAIVRLVLDDPEMRERVQAELHEAGVMPAREE